MELEAFEGVLEGSQEWQADEVPILTELPG